MKITDEAIESQLKNAPKHLKEAWKRVKNDPVLRAKLAQGIMETAQEIPNSRAAAIARMAKELDPFG